MTGAVLFDIDGTLVDSNYVNVTAWRGAGRFASQEALASSAAPDELETLRSVLDIEDSVAEITGAEDVQTAKPEPDLVRVALQWAGVPAAQAVFVGDTVWDVQACHKAKVSCGRCAQWGVSAAELTEARAVAVYDDCRAAG